METYTASCCLWAVAILNYLLCLSAGLSWLFSIWTHSCSRFLFLLITCTCWTAQWLGHYWCWLTQNLLTVSDWQQMHESGNIQICKWLRQLPHHTQVVHCLETLHCWLLLLMCQPWQNSCCQSSHLMTTKMLLWDFKKLPNHNTDAEIGGFVCHKLKIINECKSRSNMPWRWAQKVCSVLHSNKWNHNVMTIMICLIILRLPEWT